MKKTRKQGAPPQPASQGRDVATDEAHLWQAATGDVTPLNKIQNKVSPVIKASVAVSAKQPKDQTGPDISYQKSQNKPLTHEIAPGVDKRTQMRLKRGQLSVEARIDLHGMTQTEAHHALERFLGSAQDAGRRMVLVITGKGFKPGGVVGVLKQAVPKWLNEQPNRGRVSGISHASARDGGEGALYVLLKRKKP
jgi:DNA-nicking Smr family endonuclease